MITLWFDVSKVKWTCTFYLFQTILVRWNHCPRYVDVIFIRSHIPVYDLQLIMKVRVYRFFMTKAIYCFILYQQIRFSVRNVIVNRPKLKIIVKQTFKRLSVFSGYWINVWNIEVLLYIYAKWNKKILYEALSDTQQFTCNHIFCVFFIKPYNQYKQTHKLPTDTIVKKMKFPLKLLFVIQIHC